jgi:xanthine dehydrogenase accessory factor
MLASVDDILVEAQRWMEAGRSVAIATVVETWGSAPRPVGSHLVIDSEGDFLGSVSGGCVEGEVVAQALDAIATGRGQMLEFGVADETAFRAGLSCGGRILIDVRPLDPGILECLNVERAARRPCAIVTGLGSGAQRLVRAAELAADPLAKQLDERLRRRESGVEETEGGAFFITVYPPPLRLIAIGAVHIAQALAPIATLAGYETIIVDPRTAFAAVERFPGARLIGEWPATALEELGLDAAAAIALLTHDPRIDDEALIAALRAKCFYIGALGSRKTHAKRVERMRAEGFGEAELGRIHAPIGLDIGATSPAEIAVAILAEIIGSLHRRAGAARSGRAA